jgi:hypothetical protein
MGPKPETRPRVLTVRQGWLYFITLIFSVLAVTFALFESGIAAGLAKVWIICSLGSLIFLVHDILTTQPSAAYTAREK